MAHRQAELVAWIETWGPTSVEEVIRAHPDQRATRVLDRLLRCSWLGLIEIDVDGVVRRMVEK